MAELLREARERTLWLVEDVEDQDLHRVHSPLMSPLVWDLGHIAAFEDLWSCRAAGGLPPARPELAEAYDATETPRARRGALSLLRRTQALDYLEEVRERTLGVLEDADLEDPGDPLNHDGFVWEMLVQHEQQHNETMVQTLKLAPAGVMAPPRAPVPDAGAPGREWLRVEGGPFQMGDAGTGFAYDNERPRHEARVAPFEIQRVPVTNGAFRQFVGDGGYHRPELWTGEGWEWRRR